MSFTCRIITPERECYSEDGVDSVAVQGIDGEMTILAHHSPLITPLAFGEIRVMRGPLKECFAIGGGILQVADNHVLVLADSADRSEEINIMQAEESRQRAQKLMAEGASSDPDTLAVLEQAIKRANLQIRIANRRHSTLKIDSGKDVPD